MFIFSYNMRQEKLVFFIYILRQVNILKAIINLYLNFQNIKLNIIFKTNIFKLNFLAYEYYLILK
jgi:hypothetical protein